jgi:hypothetical protein
VLVVAPTALLLQPSAPQPDGTVPYELLTSHPAFGGIAAPRLQRRRSCRLMCGVVHLGTSGMPHSTPRWWCSSH